MATLLQGATTLLLLAGVCFFGLSYFYTETQTTLSTKSIHQQREFDRNEKYGNADNNNYVPQTENGENRGKSPTDLGNTPQEKLYQNQEIQRFNKSYHYSPLGNSANISTSVKHIAFLKVHKAASSTIQNLFLRYGIKNKLVFVLPKTGYTISLKRSVEVGVNVFPPPPNKSYDILCNHVIYNRLAFEKVMPKDTVYIGTVREPFSQFISNIMYGHIRHILQIPSSRPVLKFLQDTDKYINIRKSQIPVSYNRMARDFGFPQRLFLDDSDHNRINKYLYKLDQEFDLVIVTEYFDESMVLMRRLLKWEIVDILYLRQKKRRKPKVTTGEEERVLYRKWAKLDYKLYNFFVRRLLRTISLLGTEFSRELEHYRYVRKLFDRFCDLDYKQNQTIPINNSPNENSLIIQESPWNKRFVILKSECTKARQNPRVYYPLLRKRQYGLK